MVEDTDEEKFLRERYAKEIKAKTDDGLVDEDRQIRQQKMRTPGRRGEFIKAEELDKETSRRYAASEKEKKVRPQS